MIVPTEKDWRRKTGGTIRSDLDQKPAHDVFPGRSNEENASLLSREPDQALRNFVSRTPSEDA
jgi:hypothetical protein